MFEENIRRRIRYAEECRDTEEIVRVPNAGQIFENYQIMFNGIKVKKNGYCGEWMTELIRQCKGFHEPQEEKAFYEVLKRIPENSSMLEIGSYWAWYSMWFNKEVKNSKNYLVDCNQDFLRLGQENFELNNMIGFFELNEVPNFNLEYFFLKNKIDFLNILHLDIQGFEMKFLETSQEFLEKIGYIFISTHSDQLHSDCLNFLRKKLFVILCENTMQESCSVDGFIVARNSNIDTDFKEIQISKGDYKYL